MGWGGGDMEVTDGWPGSLVNEAGLENPGVGCKLEGADGVGPGEAKAWGGGDMEVTEGWPGSLVKDAGLENPGVG